MRTIARSLASLLVFLALAISAFPQEPPASAPEKKDQPQVRINYLNVCAPSEDDQKQIRAALSSVPPPKFSQDFEISRGRSTSDQAPTANWVRVRREFGPTAPFVAAQYAMTVDENSIIETLVFRSRETKDILQVQLENTVTGAQDAKSVLITDTPVNRIKLERFGKASVVLARCPSGDQTKYEPLFRQGSQLLANYRAAMGIKRLVPRELAMLGPVTPPGAKATPAAKKKK
jgi:hypothetical protein